MSALYKYISADCVMHVPTRRALYLNKAPTIHTEAYLAWAQNNTADPADPPIPEPVKTAEQIAAVAAQEALAAAKAEAKADAIVQYLRDHTPAECAQYVQDKVTDLASAKAFLKKVAAVLSVLSKEM